MINYIIITAARLPAVRVGATPWCYAQETKLNYGRQTHSFWH